MNLELFGIHHLTAITAQAAANLRFYTGTLGLRLVKKTVNQDDTSAYHLFYADGKASPGSDITFFDWPVGRERRGTHSIVRTGLRVSGEGTLDWWRARLREAAVSVGEVTERDHRASLPFEDPEGQRLLLVDDGGYPEPGLLYEGPLDLVGDAGRPLGVEAARPGDPGDLTQPVAGQLGCPLRRELVTTHELEHPCRTELGQLLLECHPVEQVLGALLHVASGVKVGGGE